MKAMNGLARSGLITMDEASCIYSTEAGRLMSVYYLDLETMKHIMKVSTYRKDYTSVNKSRGYVAGHNHNSIVCPVYRILRVG